MKTLSSINHTKPALSTLFLALSLTWGSAHAIELVPTIEDAIINNPEYRAQVNAYKGIEAEVQGAKGSWLPTIDLGMGTGLEEIDTRTSNTSLTRSESSIRATQNLFEGFRTENEIKRQEARLEAAAYSADAVANQIALDMAQAYINLQKEQDLVRLIEENRDTHLRIVDQITQRSDAGIGNQVEADQASARLALANTNLAAQQNNYNDALNRFQRILGRLPDSDLVKPTLTFSFPKSVEEATNNAILNHPTLRSANSDIAQAQAQHDSARAAYYPRVDLEVQKTFDNNIGGVEGKNENLQAMIRMRYNLYNGGKDSANRARTAAGIQQAAEIRNNTSRQTVENLRYAWDAKNYLSIQLDYIKQQVNLTKETLSGYHKQFNLGRRSLLDLLNTEDEYITAQRSLVTSNADYQVAQFRILNGMGTLLDSLQISLPTDLPEDKPAQ